MQAAAISCICRIAYLFVCLICTLDYIRTAIVRVINALVTKLCLKISNFPKSRIWKHEGSQVYKAFSNITSFSSQRNHNLRSKVFVPGSELNDGTKLWYQGCLEQGYLWYHEGCLKKIIFQDLTDTKLIVSGLIWLTFPTDNWGAFYLKLGLPKKVMGRWNAQSVRGLQEEAQTHSWQYLVHFWGHNTK